MNRYPGFLVVGFLCLALAGIGLWPASAPAQKNVSPLNIYFNSPQAYPEEEGAFGTDSEATLQQPFDHEEESNDSALSEDNFPSSI